MADESKAAAATDGAAAAASTVNQEWQLASYAEGDVTVDHLALVTIDTPAGELDEGMVHLKLAYLSVDPYMRGGRARAERPSACCGRALRRGLG